MNKAICAFVAMMMFITPVMAFDQYGRDYETIDGDIYYYNQTAYIAGINGPIEGFKTFENCTIKIATSGEITFDGKKAPFYQMKYASSPFYNGMGWNNFPTSGGEPEWDVNYLVIQFETSGEAGMYMGVCCIKGLMSPEQFMIVKKGTWNEHDVKVYAQKHALNHLFVLEFIE